MIDLLRDMLTPSDYKKAQTDRTVVTKLSDFTSWISIYGSDESLRAFHNFMQASYNEGGEHILLWLYAEFVMAARRDMGYPDTDIDLTTLLGIRVNDLYSDDGVDLYEILTAPFEGVCEKVGWTAPWLKDRTRTDGLPS